MRRAALLASLINSRKSRGNSIVTRVVPIELNVLVGFTNRRKGCEVEVLASLRLNY